MIYEPVVPNVRLVLYQFWSAIAYFLFTKLKLSFRFQSRRFVAILFMENSK